MTRQSMTVQIDDLTVAALGKIALQEDVTIGQIIRDAIRRDLRRREQAKRDNRTDERLVAPLRSLLADDLAWSKNWSELQHRLSRKGFLLKEAGGGLILIRTCDNARLCKASELGYSHARLSRRLGAAFPGHRHAANITGQIAG